MAARMAQIMGLIAAVALIVGALWGWGQAQKIADNAHSAAAFWAVRSAAVSALAGAQVLVLTFAVGAVYRRQRAGDDVLKLLVGLVCTVALVSAIALMLAGR